MSDKKKQTLKQTVIKTKLKMTWNRIDKHKKTGENDGTRTVKNEKVT